MKKFIKNEVYTFIGKRLNCPMVVNGDIVYIREFIAPQFEPFNTILGFIFHKNKIRHTVFWVYKGEMNDFIKADQKVKHIFESIIVENEI